MSNIRVKPIKQCDKYLIINKVIEFYCFFDRLNNFLI